MVIMVLMVAVVDILLLYAAGQLMGSGKCLLRYVGAALAGGSFAGLSLMRDFSFLGKLPWQICGILAVGLLAYGLSRESVCKIVLFTLLRLSVGNLAGKEALGSMVLGAAGMMLGCLCIGRKRKLIPVELNFDGRTYHITALYDTGNALRDPITGRGVLIVDVNIACSLTGLKPSALQDPVSNLLSYPGLRLIPYKSVGNSGFLLALRIPEAKIGNHKESILVALSPNLLSNHYQALTGGTL